MQLYDDMRLDNVVVVVVEQQLDSAVRDASRRVGQACTAGIRATT